MTGIKLAAAASAVGVLATAATPIDVWARLAIEAPLVAIIGVLLLRTLPQLNEQHRKAVERLSRDLETLASGFKESNERLMRLLEGELHDNDSGTS